MASGEQKPQSLRSLARLRGLDLEGARQALARQTATLANAQRAAGAAEAALQAHQRRAPRQVPGRMAAASLRRQGAQLRAHLGQQAKLRAALAKAHSNVRSAETHLQRVRAALHKADAEHRVVQNRQAQHTQAARRTRHLADADEIDELAAARATPRR